MEISRGAMVIRSKDWPVERTERVGANEGRRQMGRYPESVDAAAHTVGIPVRREL